MKACYEVSTFLENSSQKGIFFTTADVFFNKAVSHGDPPTLLSPLVGAAVGCFPATCCCCCCRRRRRDQTHPVRTVGWQRRQQLSAHVATLCTQLGTADSLALAKTSVRDRNQFSCLISKQNFSPESSSRCYSDISMYFLLSGGEKKKKLTPGFASFYFIKHAKEVNFDIFFVSEPKRRGR